MVFILPLYLFEKLQVWKNVNKLRATDTRSQSKNKKVIILIPVHLPTILHIYESFVLLHILQQVRLPCLLYVDQLHSLKEF